VHIWTDFNKHFTAVFRDKQRNVRCLSQNTAVKYLSKPNIVPCQLNSIFQFSSPTHRNIILLLLAKHWHLKINMKAKVNRQWRQWQARMERLQMAQWGHRS